MHLLNRVNSTKANTNPESTTVNKRLSTVNGYTGQETLSKRENKFANLAAMDPAALSKKSRMERKDTTYHIEISLQYKAEPGI
jgi:hypothetical protein